MNSVQSSTTQNLVTLAGNRLVTDSRKVANHFGKRHDNVIRAIRNLDCSEEFAHLNFEECLQINELANGKQEVFYTMTKDGFYFLVMGFTGREAARLKESFISAFNAMADYINGNARGIQQRYFAYVEKETGSKVRGSYGSRLMLTRKQELKNLRKELEELEQEMQLSLPILLH